MESRNARGTSRGAGDRSGRADEGKQPTVEELRRLLVGPEQSRLERLEAQPPISADSVGKVLPEALATSREERADELTIALEPTMTSALRTVARREADFLGEVLSPTIGAAVRKAVADAIAAMMQKFDEALERSLSFQSMQWRVEARRTGRPFAEVVLLHTLVYRVEEVFLIHPATGLVLERVAAQGAGVLEPDQVASMLVAIDSFVRESFAPLPAGVHVGRIEFGDHVLWIERSPDVGVAALVRGVAPHAFGNLLRETRERVHLLLRDELERFASDVSPFSVTRPLLERCITVQRRPSPRRAQLWLPIAAGLALIGAGMFAGTQFARAAVERHVLQATVSALAAEPGIAVLEADWSHRHLRVRGFRDPLANAPDQVLAAHGLPGADLELAPYASFDPRILERHVRQKLRPPEGATLALVGDVLHARGVAPRSWIEEARHLAPVLPGVERYDDSDLRSAEAVEGLGTAAAALERVEILFPLASSDPGAAAGVLQARQGARQLAAAGAEAREKVCVSVVGHADPSGPEELNLALSEARARNVAGDLAAHGVDRDLFRSIGADVSKDPASYRRARSVTFHVDVGCGGQS